MTPVVSRTLDYLDSLLPYIGCQNVSIFVTTLLMEMGFEPDWDGFNHVRQLIVLCCHNPEMRINDLYIELIRLNHDKYWNSHQLTQSIHATIIKGYDNRVPEIWNALFNQDTWDRPPQNKILIMRLGRLMEVWECKRRDEHGTE